MNTQVGKWGKSLAVRIPESVAKELNLQEGSEVEVTRVEGGILLRPKQSVYTRDDLLARITPENVHGETRWGKAVGREAW